MINWQRLADAMAYWRATGCTVVEVPWTVPIEVARTTHRGTLTYGGRGAMVGSAEQGFIDMQMRGAIQHGWYVACSPCFRDEVPDDLHQREFMKVEVYVPNPKRTDLDIMLNRATAFFNSLAAPLAVTREQTADGVDLLLNGIEIGSYGVRNIGGLEWLYGTGLAEPRFSVASKA